MRGARVRGDRRGLGRRSVLHALDVVVRDHSLQPVESLRLVPVGVLGFADDC